MALAFVVIQATDYSVALAAQPTANAGGPYSGNEGSAISFTGSALDVDEDSSNLTFQWDFSFQSTFNVDKSGKGMATTTNTYSDDNGSEGYTVALRVIDSTGATSTVSTAQVTVSNVPPSANAGGPYTVNEGSALTFNGNATDPGNDTLTFEWDFDYDGSTFTVDNSGVSNPTNTYTNDGSKTVGLRVRDDDGGVSSIATATTTINNVPATATIGTSFTGTEGTAVAFSSNATDPGADTLTYEWDFSFVTGTFNVDQSGDGLKAPNHTYTNDGDFIVALRVRDDDSTSSQVTASVTISNVVPTASVGGPYTGALGSPITFSGSATDPGADTLTYEWDFQYNGTTFSTVGATTNSGVDLTAPKYTYTTSGTFTVALRVKDDKGVSSIKSAQVTVSGASVPSANQWGLLMGGLALGGLVLWRIRKPVMAATRR
jgi:hypothetical protein